MSAALLSWPTRLANLPRDARDTLFLLLVIAWILLPQSLHMPWWSTGFWAGLLLWRAGLAWRSRPLPRRWLLTALLLLAMVLTWSQHRTLVGRDAGVSLVILLLALKTLEMRSHRDAMVLFFLGFFALLSNFFASQSLPLALAMVLGLLGLLTALVNAHMPVGRPPLLQALRTAGRLTLLGAPIMVLLFVFFPRFAPLWGMPGSDLAGRSGLSEHMRVGDVASLALDESIAMRLRFDNPLGEAPAASALYFRGPVLSRFDGREWQLDMSAMALEDAQLKVSGEPVRYEMTIEPSRRPWLVMLDATPEPPALSSQHRVGQPRMTSTLQWLTQRPITDVLRVQAKSYPEFRHGPLQDHGSLARYTDLPAGSNPRTLELGQQLRASLPQASPQELVQAAMQRLRTGGYTYTLEPGTSTQLHTADEFWFDSKQGFCEHIASAFAVLLRGMDMPTRIVTGYQGGERNPIDGYWNVRNSDAHAWTEVWLAGQGWVRIDPTAAVAPGRVGQFQRLQAPSGAIATAMGHLVSPSALQHLRALWDATNNRWSQWVLNYSQSRQMDLLGRWGLKAPSTADLLRVIGAATALAAMLALVWSARQRQRVDPWLRLITQAQKRLRQAGLAVHDSQPPRALAEQVNAQWAHVWPEHAQALGQWLLQMERQRYAPATAQRESMATLRRQWRALAWPRTASPPTALTSTS